MWIRSVNKYKYPNKIVQNLRATIRMQKKYLYWVFEIEKLCNNVSVVKRTMWSGESPRSGNNATRACWHFSFVTKLVILKS